MTHTDAQAPAQAHEPDAGASFPGPDLLALLHRLADGLRGPSLMLATAESCTGGLIAGACTELPGSSDWFDRGVVSYSNGAKTELLGVPAALIQAHGAVSAPVARAMASGMLARSEAAIAVAVTGVAGPGGGTADKPVGLVWLAWAWRGVDGAALAVAGQRQFAGDRAAVRRATAHCALDGVLFWLAQGRAPVVRDGGAVIERSP